MTSYSNSRCVVWVQPRNPAAALYPYPPSVPGIPNPSSHHLQPLELIVGEGRLNSSCVMWVWRWQPGDPAPALYPYVPSSPIPNLLPFPHTCHNPSELYSILPKSEHIIVGEGWEGIIWNALQTINYLQMLGEIHSERQSIVIYPAHEDVFAWTMYCRPDQVKVGIVGQDPYYNGCADGLAFSMPGERPEDSLENIMKLLPRNWDCDKNRPKPEEYIHIPADGNLEGWARQGVLLLNRILTVREGVPGSHKGLGWEEFTDFIIHHLHQTYSGIVFILWGKKAGKLLKILNESERCLIDGNYQTCQKCKYKVHNCLKHYHVNRERVAETRCELKGNCFLQSGHPSPKAVNTGGDFLRQSHLIMANEFLALTNREINW